MINDYKKIIKRYFEVAKLKKKYFISMFILELIYKLVALLMVFFASWIVKYATAGEITMTWISLGLLFTTFVIYTLFNYWSYRVYGKNMHYTFTTLQTFLLNKVMGSDEYFTEQVSKGKLLNSIIEDPIEVGDNCNQITELFTTIIQVICVIIITGFYNPWFVLIFLAYIIIHVVVRDWSVKNYLRYYRKEKYQTDKYSSLLSQMLSGLQEIKTFNMLDKLNSKLAIIQQRFTKAYSIKRKYKVIGFNDIRLNTYGFRIIIYAVLLVMMINGDATIDVLVLIIGYHESLVIYLNRALDSMESLRATDVSVDRINNIVHYKEGKKISYGLNKNDDIIGSVEFKNVTFGYNDKTILKNMSFKLEPHTITALVGPSGTGKTSIINLLLRLHVPEKGKIFIDGINIFDYSENVYSTNVAVVNQKPFIFNLSIRKNLNFIDKNVDNQIAACKRVGIHDFIMSLPKGYNTILREDAANISGGQKQLISLARTLLSTSEILLFDEVTSALDPETTIQIEKVLKELKQDHTIILITHKPETMKRADRIIVINDGHIVGDGKHNDLIKSSEEYKWLQARKSASKLGVFNND